jgi:hypothetical protein
VWSSPRGDPITLLREDAAMRHSKTSLSDVDWPSNTCPQISDSRCHIRRRAPRDGLDRCVPLKLDSASNRHGGNHMKTTTRAHHLGRLERVRRANERIERAQLLTTSARERAVELARKYEGFPRNEAQRRRLAKLQALQMPARRALPNAMPCPRDPQ